MTSKPNSKTEDTMPDSRENNTLSIDPIEFLAGVERVWRAHDGVTAAAAYTDDAVVYYGENLTHTGEKLRAWPTRWFEYTKDLDIRKTYRGHAGDCIVGTWESNYTSPETGKKVYERGAELFFVRGDMVYEHHMWQHSWAEVDIHNDKGFAT